jgi:hypothetical protein
MLLKIILKMVKNSFDLAFNFHLKICLDFVSSVLAGWFLKRGLKNNFQKMCVWLQKSYLEKYGSKINETNFVVILMTRYTF